MKEWEKFIRKTNPYTPGEQPLMDEKIIKLNTNENPYPPAENVQKLLKEYDAEQLRLYPSPDAAALIHALAKYHHVTPWQVFAGVGSDDVLAMAFLTFFNGEIPILFPDITYSFYKVWAGLYRIPYQTKALNADLKINKEDYYVKNGGIVLANPNAPTAIAEPLSFIEDILLHNQESVVIVDEAYIDFYGFTALPLVQKYENLLVVQTYSKSRSMAGIRIGYAVGNEKLIHAMNAVKHSYNSYTLNRLSIECGVQALQDETYFQSRIQKVIETREKTKKRMEELGFWCTDSKTNFLFAKHNKVEAEKIFYYLKEHAVYVRYFNAPILSDYLRITIGTDDEMEKVMDLFEIM